MDKPVFHLHLVEKQFYIGRLGILIATCHKNTYFFLQFL